MGQARHGAVRTQLPPRPRSPSRVDRVPEECVWPVPAGGLPSGATVGGTFQNIMDTAEG